MSSSRTYRRLKAPFRLMLEVTARCTCSCFHCFNHWRQPDNALQTLGGLDMTMEAAELIVQKALAAGVFELIISGGEPLLNYPVSERVTVLGQQAQGVSMNSNLIPLNAKMAEFLVEHHVSILTSILGPDAKTHDLITGTPGSFAGTVRGFQLLKQAGYVASVHMVLTRQNFRMVRQTGEFLAQIGADNYTVTPAVRPVSCRDFSAYQLTIPETIECFNDALWARDKFGLQTGTRNAMPLCCLEGVTDVPTFAGLICPCGLHQMIIGVDGGVRPCAHFERTEGNLLTEDLSDIWQRMDHWRTGECLPSACKKCQLLERCGGGCRYLALDNQTEDGCPDPRMDAAKAEGMAACFGDKTAAAVQPTEHFRVKHFQLRREEFGSVVHARGKKIFLPPEATLLLEQLKPGSVYKTDAFAGSVPAGFIEGLALREVVEFLGENADQAFACPLAKSPVAEDDCA